METWNSAWVPTYRLVARPGHDADESPASNSGQGSQSGVVHRVLALPSNGCDLRVRQALSLLDLDQRVACLSVTLKSEIWSREHEGKSLPAEIDRRALLSKMALLPAPSA